jgi:hypothetical protein
VSDMAKYRDSRVTAGCCFSSANLMNLDEASASWPILIELSTVCFGSRMVFLMDRELLRRTWQNIGSRLVVAFVYRVTAGCRFC